jgi:cytochrome c
MKKVLVSFSIIVLIAACNNSKDSGNTAKSGTTTPAAPADPAAEKGLQLVAKSDCFQCHKIDETFTGPAYMAVADRYRDKDREQTIDSLSKKIINGGAGNWGTIPMIPHASLSADDARAMVTYILSLKK